MIGNRDANARMSKESLLGHEVLEDDSILPSIGEYRGCLAIDLRRPRAHQSHVARPQWRDREGNRPAHGVEVARAAGQISRRDATIVGEHVAQEWDSRSRRRELSDSGR